VIERPVKNTNSDLLKQLKQKSENNLNSASKYHFVYIPSTIKDKMIVFKNDIKKYIDNTNINKFISDLRINFYKESTDRR
jgi:retron-type reverse transcriptase